MRRINSYTIFKEEDERTNNVKHDFINKMFANRTHIPHEWWFINLLYKEEIKKNKDLAQKFLIFALEFYPDYKWSFELMPDITARVISECNLRDYQFLKVIKGVSSIDEEFYQAMDFGEIVTDFLIRYCNYNLINLSSTGVILTAQSDCDKRFFDYLEQGYSLHRVSKVFYNEDSSSFTKLPVFPTKTLEFPFTEIIEGSDGNFRPVLEEKSIGF